MAMIRYDDVNQMMRAHQRSILRQEAIVEEAAGLALQSMLNRMIERTQAGLTASFLPVSFGTGELFALGEVRGWWADAVDENLVRSLSAAWTAGYRATSDLGMIQGSFDASGSYVASVRDRLSRTQTPLISDQAFDVVRQALIEEMGRGSSTSVISQRIASDLNWRHPDAQFWDARRIEIRNELDAILDAAGPVGSPQRETMRLNDPQVRQLRNENASVVRKIDADQSTWRRRAEAIARTETTAAWNAGSLDAAIREDQQVKVWLALGDDRTRDSHLSAAGQCVDVNADFVVGGAYMPAPGIGGPAEEVVGCRCSMLFAESCGGGSQMAAPAVAVWDELAEERGLARVPLF